ncbi:MAG: hypothetical protein KDA44_15345 [Planctomycetales bacterium]|nr:hypothetical protein [Planctomycetales bacterium]
MFSAVSHGVEFSVDNCKLIHRDVQEVLAVSRRVMLMMSCRGRRRSEKLRSFV